MSNVIKQDKIITSAYYNWYNSINHKDDLKTHFVPYEYWKQISLEYTDCINAFSVDYQYKRIPDYIPDCVECPLYLLSFLRLKNDQMQA